jgi:hypothetical protein
MTVQLSYHSGPRTRVTPVREWAGAAQAVAVQATATGHRPTLLVRARGSATTIIVSCSG